MLSCNSKKIEHKAEMTADQAFKHFDSAQCDIRVLATLIHLMHMLSDIYNVILNGVEGKNDNLSLVAESKHKRGRRGGNKMCLF
jgi:hypothetical protein